MYEKLAYMAMAFGVFLLAAWIFYGILVLSN